MPRVEQSDLRMLTQACFAESPTIRSKDDVVFRAGEKYRYKDVPPDEYDGLMEAQSHSKFMRTRIIDRYEVESLEN